MVKGLDLFTEYFRDYNESYILIGGAAVDIWMEELELRFRATEDLDIILVIEALNEKFVKHFWKFIEEGEYKTKEKGNGKQKVYRFTHPGKDTFPKRIELFARKPDILGDFEKAHLTPIPLGEDIGSLSAILMNEEYYAFTRKNSVFIDGLHLATTPALICLKVMAFLDYKERLDKKDWVDKNDESNVKEGYKKHMKDVVRISLTLSDADKTDMEDHMKEGIKKFIEAIKAYPPDFKQLAKNFEVEKIRPDEIFKQLQETFEL